MNAAAVNHHPAIPDLIAALRAIPQHEKMDYLHALRVAPHLVLTESDPLAFLRFCDWEPTAAARRLTVYWRQRKEVFGPDRAFLPLLNDFSGNGALGSEELEVVRSGVLCLMPNDAHARAVCFFDRTKVPPFARNKPDVRVRAVFLAFAQLALNPISQTSGVVVVAKGMLASDRDSIGRRMAELVHGAFPLHIAAVHFIYLREERRGLRASIVPFLLSHFGGVFSRNIRVHDCESVEQVVENMARHGVLRESLPISMGGFAGTDGTAFSVDLSPLSTSSGPNTHGVAVGENGQDHHHHQQQQQYDSEPLSVVTPAVNEFPLRHTDFHSLGSESDHDGTFSERYPQLLDPTPIVSPPDQLVDLKSHPVGQAAGNDDALPDVNDALFARILDMTDFEGSPFEPRPICETILPQVDDTPYNGLMQGATGSSADVSLVHNPSPIHSPQQNQPVTTRSPVSASALNNDGETDNDVPFIETQGMLERGLGALSEAMSALPGDERAAFEDAIRRAPDLVQTETDPKAYLRFDKFDGWATARRLSAYWQHRVQYFGDKAFLPLTQTTGGALWEEDFQTLASRFFHFLPVGSRGRPVLCCDPSKCPQDSSKASRIRVAMYFFSILWREYPVAMVEGCFIVVFVSGRIMDLSKVFDDTIRKVTDIALDAFPIKKCETHVVYSPSPMDNPERSFSKFVLPVLLRAIGRLLSHDRSHFHVGETRDELGRELASCGLSHLSLQAVVNGGISEHDFCQWLKNRRLLESQNCAPSHQHQLQQPQRSPSAVTDGSSGTTARQNSAPPNSIEGGPTHLGDIDRAIASLTTSEKKDYLEAKKQVPDLVEKESDQSRFLKVERYDALAAGRRIAAYWRIRRELFRERWVMPLDQTTGGALDRKDVAFLQTGFLTQLPNDSGGRSVVCFDGSRLDKSSSPESQLRIFFYMWSVLSQNDLSQTDGYRVLYNMTDISVDRVCRTCLDLVMEAHPVRLKCFHLLGCCPDGTNESDFRQGAVREMIRLSDRSIQEKILVHTCESRSGFTSNLIGHGMFKDGLPRVFGGKWGLEDFVLWQELRMRYEWHLHICDSELQLAERYSIPTFIVSPAPANLSEDEKAERKRRLNVIHSRRKRERKRIEVQVLREQCSSLEEEQKDLLREGCELEELLQRAQILLN